jgi:hypothetical protein
LKKIEYIFFLTINESIIITVIEEYDTYKIFYDTFSNVFFSQKEMKILLAHDTLYEECRLLNTVARNALEKKNFLDEITMSDIGIIYNETFNKSVSSKYTNLEAEELLKKIAKYTLWSPIVSMNNMRTWFYTNTSGEIILFIAPVYPFTFSSKRVKGYMPYDEWIKSYKPFVKRIISPETAQAWIKQTDEIMTLIQKNSESNSKKNIHDDVGRPKNGQKALDNSIAFKQTSSVRVGVSDNQLVILTKTKDNVSHGHVAGWDDLELAMQDALLDAGLVTQYGKILCKN